MKVALTIANVLESNETTVARFLHVASNALSDWGNGTLPPNAPNKSTMVMREDENVESESFREESLSSSEGESSSVYLTDEGDILMVRKLLSTQVNEDKKSQRENIFHSLCHVKRKLFSLIIDGGSNVNVASFRLVEKLNLPTLAHPKPYNLQWLSKKGEMIMKEFGSDVYAQEASRHSSFELRINSFQELKFDTHLGRHDKHGNETKHMEVKALQVLMIKESLKRLKGEVRGFA
ncbi:hypothetical protein CR513_46475, partial [Mucuna pruriens]